MSFVAVSAVPLSALPPSVFAASVELDESVLVADEGGAAGDVDEPAPLSDFAASCAAPDEVDGEDADGAEDVEGGDADGDDEVDGLDGDAEGVDVEGDDGVEITGSPGRDVTRSLPDSEQPAAAVATTASATHPASNSFIMLSWAWPGVRSIARKAAVRATDRSAQEPPRGGTDRTPWQGRCHWACTGCATAAALVARLPRMRQWHHVNAEHADAGGHGP